MKNLMTRLWFLPVLCLLVLAGCSKDENPANGGNGGGGGNNNQGNWLPTDFGGAAPTHVFALIRTTTTQGGFSFDFGVGVANLAGQDKGDVSVTISGTAYGFAKLNESGTVSYVFPNPQNPTQQITLPASAVSVTFAATGYALSSGTVVVPGQISLTAPTANSTVPRNSALTVTWTGTNGQTTAIAIADGSGNFIFKQNLGNVNTASFTAAEMGQLQAGAGIVYAITYNYELVNNNEAVLIGQATALNNITLQ